MTHCSSVLVQRFWLFEFISVSILLVEPCVPTSTWVSVSVSSTPCLYNTAVVSWSASQGAVQYTVSAWSSRGNATCRSSDLHCTLNVTCGSNYTVAVTAINGNCSSPPSQPWALSSGKTWRIRTNNNCNVLLHLTSWFSSERLEWNDWILK